MRNFVRFTQASAGRYLIIGGSVYVFELVVIVLAQAAGLRATAAVAMSFCLGTIVSFLLQKFVTFGDRRVHHRVVTWQVAATALLVMVNFGFSVLVAYAFEHVLPAIVSRTLALAITTSWNFYAYKHWIFKNVPHTIY